MNKNRKNSRNRQIRKKTTVIRCKAHSKPVFGHETCATFSSKNSVNDNKICENCSHSF